MRPVRWIANLALIGAQWCAGLIVLLLAGGPRPPLAPAVTPAAVILIVTVPMAILYRIYFRHRPDLEYEEFRRARWLTAVPLGLRLCLFAGLAGFWIVARIAERDGQTGQHSSR
jgi:hypothetical protein